MMIWPTYEITLQFDEMLALAKLLGNLGYLNDYAVLKLEMTDKEAEKIKEIYRQIKPFVPKLDEE